MAATLEKDADTGAEIRVETGTGKVTRLEYKGRNVGVEIDSDNPQMRLPVKGWADSQNADLIALLTEAEGGDKSVAYRIVVHRKAQIAPGIPLAELAPVDKVRDFVAAYWADQQPAAQPEATERPTAAPSSAPGPEPRPTAPQTEDKAHAARCEAMAKRQENQQTPDRQPTVGDSRPAARPGVKVAEEKRWEPFNTDGSLNVGSYAFAASQRAISHAGRLFRQYLREEAQPFGEGGEDAHQAPDVQRCKGVARHLLNAADEAQAAVRQDAHHDRMDASFNVALNAVVDASYIFVPPFAQGNDPAVVKTWREALTAYAVASLWAARDLTTEALS